MKYLVLLSCLVLSACATHSVELTSTPMEKFDSQASYNLERLTTGLKINVKVEKWTYSEDGSGMALLCKDYVRRILGEQALKTKDALNTISDDQIFASFGYNGWSGYSTCTAQAFAKFK